MMTFHIRPLLSANRKIPFPQTQLMWKSKISLKAGMCGKLYSMLFIHIFLAYVYRPLPLVTAVTVKNGNTLLHDSNKTQVASLITE